MHRGWPDEGPLAVILPPPYAVPTRGGMPQRWCCGPTVTLPGTTVL